MKVLLVNGSPHPAGCTYTALKLVAGAIEEEGIEAEIYHIPNDAIRGCISCGACMRNKTGRCAFDGDAVNIILEKLETSDALIIGSPVYYASPNGHMLAVMDRVFYAGDKFEGKPGAAVCSARRGGTTATLDALNKYFPINGMPTVPSFYWTMVHGNKPEEVLQDSEGVQVMQMLGKNTAWLLKSIEAGKAAGLKLPQLPGGKKQRTNFIR
ncbi:MAG: flavodoxin family protein [Clostridiales Family XIII bacterium]|jgi:multimeric flavodoxin WrbA|nr:flavodoxin family protein [Clostridiales Family XIII bacterium]